MYQINTITSDYNQVKTMVLPDGTVITMTLVYVPLQLSWVILNLTYKTFVLNSIRVSVSPNLLHQYVNQLPFGLTCVTALDREPTLRQDFSSGAFSLFVLTAAEAASYTRYLSGI